MEDVRLFLGRWGVFLALWGYAISAGLANPAYDPPAGYYTGSDGMLGPDLQAVLHQKIRAHTVLSYGSGGTVPALRVLDAMPNDPTQVNLIYWGTGRAGSNYGGGAGQWNHEHLWPQSYGVSSGPGNSDLFELRPCDVSANSERGSKYFQEIIGGTVPTHAPLCRKTSPAWMPRPEEKGDIARAMFYMAVRYEGGDGTPDLKLSDTPNAAAYTFGRLSDLLAWHREDPVDESERKRNHLIYTSYQFNRNPFVDDPDFAEMVFRGVPVVRIAAVRSQAVEGGAETNAAAVVVSRRGPLTNELTVALSYGGNSSTNELVAAPVTVTIPAGMNSVEVTLQAAVNAGIQGDRNLTVGPATNAAYAAVDGAVTLTLTDAAESGLPSWAAEYGLTGANAAGTADPDGDGMDNNAELAFGTSPVSGASRAATLATGTGTIKLTYLQRDSGVNYTVKSLPDLATAFDSGTTVTPSVSADQSNKPAGYTRYEAELNTGSTRGFLRVRAVR